MNPTERVQLGKTSLRVTRLGLGGTAIAGLYHDVREEAAIQTVQRALALGTNLIDTAPLYGAGKSEQRVGLSLAGVKHNSFILASKVGYGLVEQKPGTNEDIFFPFENAPPLRPVMDFSYDGVMRSMEQSLRRLGLDRVDILHIHDPHDHYDEALKGAYKALDKLREEKIIVAVGVGMNRPEMLVRFAREANFDCFLLAGRFTLIDHTDAKELLSLCIENHISIILGGPYNSGILATGSTPGTTFNYLSAPPDVLEKVRQIEVVCERHSVPLKAAALQFPLTHPAVVSVIPGARSPEEVTENFQMMSYPIQEAFWDELHARNFLPQERVRLTLPLLRRGRLRLSIGNEFKAQKSGGQFQGGEAVEQTTGNRLSAEQRAQYEEQGYYFPVRAFEPSEAGQLRERFDGYFSSNWEKVKNLPARQHSSVLGETHTVLNWVHRIVSDPRVLDAVESVLGPNLLVWSSAWFPKMPGDKKYISWHQDATYWGLRPPLATTAWIAISESTTENGCMRVVPATHKGPLLPQIETYAQNNALSRGQEIAVEVDEATAVDLVLQPGEMSLHHIGMVHGSKANESTKARIGLAVRYISTEVVQDVKIQQCAVLVRGKDTFGHFQLIDPPTDDEISSEDEARRAEVLSRMRLNLVPDKPQRDA